jgi:hypothetical protein
MEAKDFSISSVCSTMSLVGCESEGLHVPHQGGGKLENRGDDKDSLALQRGKSEGSVVLVAGRRNRY